jgi:hypothetical protein
MDSQFRRWLSFYYLIVVLWRGTESHTQLNSRPRPHESSTEKQASSLPTNSIDHVGQHRPTVSVPLAKATTAFHSSRLVQSLITKPNSYLYNPKDDDETPLDRVKRDPAPFVCKSKFIPGVISSSILVLADGYFPDRHNCRIYHICTSGVDTASVCGEGTAWDPVKKNCGWENTVECKKGLRRWDQITDIRGGTQVMMMSVE